MADNKNTRGRRLKDRYKGLYPDKDFETEEGMYELDEMAANDLDDLSSRDEQNKAQNKQLLDLYNSDPRSAAMMNAWASGENPLSFMVRNFGDDFINALETEEGKEAFNKSHQEWLDRVAEDKKFEDETNANIDKSLADLENFKTEHNLSDEQASELFNKVYQMGVDILNGKLLPEYFEMAMKAGDYDSAVESARKEGEVHGRNEQIEEKLRSSDKAKRNYPPMLGGQGAAQPEEKPAKPKRHNMFGL